MIVARFLAVVLLPSDADSAEEHHRAGKFSGTLPCANGALLRGSDGLGVNSPRGAHAPDTLAGSTHVGCCSRILQSVPNYDQSPDLRRCCCTRTITSRRSDAPAKRWEGEVA